MPVLVDENSFPRSGRETVVGRRGRHGPLVLRPHGSCRGGREGLLLLLLLQRVGSDLELHVVGGSTARRLIFLVGAVPVGIVEAA